MIAAFLEEGRRASKSVEERPEVGYMDRGWRERLDTDPGPAIIEHVVTH